MKENKHIKIGVGAIIINEKGEVLLLKRSKNLKTVEFGETLEQALKREVKEEIGVDVEIIRFLEYTEMIEMVSIK